MLHTIARIAFALPVLPLLAQAPDGDLRRTAITRNSGLESAGPDALRGGGADYDARFDQAGMRYEPALGSAIATTQHLQLRPVSVGRRGVPAVELPWYVTPIQQQRTATYAHGPAVRERFACRPEGVELSWVFDQRPAGSGDLVVRYLVDTSLPAPTRLDDGTLAFALAGIGGVTIGTVTGIDADGNEVAGQLRWDRGELEMSLPGGFVDDARYPLVLDPLIGTKFDIHGGASYDDADPDCAFESSEDRYLVVFLRTFSAGDVRVRAQLVNADGTLQYGVLWISSNGVVAGRPRVASHSLRGQFGVVWTEDISTSTVALFQSVPAVGSPVPNSLPSPVSIGSSTQGTVLDLDIGSEKGTFGQPQAFVTVWHDTNDGRVYARRVGYNAAGLAVANPVYTVFSNSLFAQFSEPAIARAAAQDGKLMVVTRKWTGLGPQIGVTSALLSASDNTVSAVTTIVSGSAIDVARPDVDGHGSDWVVAWEQNNIGSTLTGVRLRSARWNGSSVQLGGIEAIGGSVFSQTSYPTVGYSHGKTWVAYRNYAGLGGSWSFQARGLDSTTCLSCSDSFSEALVNGTQTRIVAATSMSGNDLQRDQGLIVWAELDDIWAQRIENHQNGGAVVNQGGGCGTGGNQNATAPATGMSRVNCSVTGLSPTALLSVFNLTESSLPITCGTCQWLPFSVTLVVPVTQFQNAQVEYTVPCAPSLVGAQFETQWTTIDPNQAPCALVPGFAISDRFLHTIGQ